MTTALSKYEPKSLEELESASKRLIDSGLLPKELRSPAQVATIIQTGAELGLPALMSLRSMYVVNGRAIMSSDAMVSFVVRSPECEYFMRVESDDKSATYETKRKGHPQPVRHTFTLEMATRAGLLSNPTWKKYPDVMLRHRCASALARDVYPDLVLGVYDETEAVEMAPARDVTPTVTVEQVHRAAEVEARQRVLDAGERAIDLAAAKFEEVLDRIDRCESVACLEGLVTDLKDVASRVHPDNASKMRTAYMDKLAALRGGES